MLGRIFRRYFNEELVRIADQREFLQPEPHEKVHDIKRPHFCSY